MKNKIFSSLKFEWKQDTLSLLIIAAMSFIQAVAINGFYVPHRFLSGGLTGVALLLDYIVELPSWIPLLVLNIPVGLIGFKYLPAKQVLFSFVSFGLFTLALVLTGGVDFGVQNPIISGISGGAILGITSAFVVKRDATVGGIDIIAAILAKRYSVAMGTICIIFNMVVMGVLAVLSGLELGLISMLAMFACNLVFNAMLRSFNRTATVFIISDKAEEIAHLVLQKLNRGVTFIPAEGAYTGEPKKILYCIVRTVELSSLRRLVHEHDPAAMFSTIETREVMGRGFAPLS